MPNGVYALDVNADAPKPVLLADRWTERRRQRRPGAWAPTARSTSPRPKPRLAAPRSRRAKGTVLREHGRRARAEDLEAEGLVHGSRRRLQRHAGRHSSQQQGPRRSHRPTTAACTSSTAPLSAAAITRRRCTSPASTRPSWRDGRGWPPGRTRERAGSWRRWTAADPTSRGRARLASPSPVRACPRCSAAARNRAAEPGCGQPRPTGAIVAFKLVEQGGKLTLERAWASRDHDVAADAGDLQRHRLRGVERGVVAPPADAKTDRGATRVKRVGSGGALRARSGHRQGAVEQRQDASRRSPGPGCRRRRARSTWSRTTTRCMPSAMPMEH